MTQKLVVISGPANTGKMPLARKLAADHPEYKIVHRDDLRRMFINPVTEDHITVHMYFVGHCLLSDGHTPVMVAWNLEQSDRNLWEKLARVHKVPLEWLDITKPEVAAMIPPMEPAPAPVQHVAVPEGWQLVPKIPTTEMECAPDHEDCQTPDAAKAAYRAMLKAAPPLPLDIVTVSVIHPEVGE